MPEPTAVRPAHAVSALLSGHARELYDDLRLVPLLRQLIRASCRLTDAAGGSISIVSQDRGCYTKAVEWGTACRLGQNFPLDEGVTGLVMRQRRPVALSRYRDIAVGHVPAGHQARDRAVAAFPIWWRGDIIGVNVVFAGHPEAFTVDEIDQLEALTQLVAPGLVAAGQRDLSLDYFKDCRVPFGAESAGAAVAIGDAGARTASVAKVARDLLVLTDQAAVHRTPLASLHVAVVPSDTGLRLLIQRDPQDEKRIGLPVPRPSDWQELVDRRDGGVDVKAPPVSETVRCIDWPNSALPQANGRPREASPFTLREQQVACLLVRGLSDRAIAEGLVISPKTVEKHVGAVLRKTGTTGRTAAVVRILAAGWLERELLDKSLPEAN